MGQIITSTDKFAAWFNSIVPGAPRRISAEDVGLLTKCGLVGCYGYYGHVDLETVRGILQYESLREEKAQTQSSEASAEPPRCKHCGQPLPPKPEGKRGRPKEYCKECEFKRARLRNRKWRMKKRAGLTV